MDIIRLIYPELAVLAAATLLFLMGMSGSVAVRRAAPWIALLGLLVAAFLQVGALGAGPLQRVESDLANTLRGSDFSHFIKLLVACVGVLFVLLSWPSNREQTGNSALGFDREGPEYFALVLCAVSGVMLVSCSNDMLLLFMGIELASIPTYVLVSMSRPLAVAQEAGVKYFFLGAMSAALLLFGFSYLYGTTGLSDFHAIASQFAETQTINQSTSMSAWTMLAFVMIFVALAFKLAAVPLHFYAGDVYEGAATPVTALLSFVPKVTGVVALVKLIWVAGAGVGAVPEQLAYLLWWMAVLTMTVGNVLALWQNNVKRLLAYSSVAHSGYLLVGLATYAWMTKGGGAPAPSQRDALQGVIFYVVAYGIMNAGAFGVLMLLPTRQRVPGIDGRDVIPPATSAETFEDIQGVGRRYPALGLAMAVACFSLIGLPLTVGFWGKVFLILPALHAGLYALVVITVVNAAISAGYYLRIVGAMFLHSPGRDEASAPGFLLRSTPITVAIAISVFGSMLFGTLPQAVELLHSQAVSAAVIETESTLPLDAAASLDAR